MKLRKILIGVIKLLYPIIGALTFIFIVGWINLIVEYLRKKFFIEKQKLNEYEEERKTENKKIIISKNYNHESAILNNPFSFGLFNGFWEVIIKANESSDASAILIMEFSGGNIFIDKDKSNSDSIVWRLKEINRIEHLAFDITNRVVSFVFSVRINDKIEFLEYLEFRKLKENFYTCEYNSNSSFNYYLVLKKHNIKRELKND